MDGLLVSKIVVLLGTMEGKYWPALPPPRDDDDEDGLDPDRASYVSVLEPLTDAVGEAILPRLLTAFQQRPSHKALRDWAVSLGPQRGFDIRELAGPAQGIAPRLTGPRMERLGGACPESVKARMREFAHAAPPPDTAAEYGLQVRHRQTNVATRTQAGYTLQRAEFIAAERNRKWKHTETTVFRRDDPWPEGAVRVRAEPITPEQWHTAQAERRKTPPLPAPAPDVTRPVPEGAGA